MYLQNLENHRQMIQLSAFSSKYLIIHKMLVLCKKLHFTYCIIFATLACNWIQRIECHGTMIDPVSRNSLWRVEPDAPVNYNDIELFCGGFGVSRIIVCPGSIKY